MEDDGVRVVDVVDVNASELDMTRHNAATVDVEKFIIDNVGNCAGK